MQIEDRYRAALVALRDGQWEDATHHLLSIAAEAPRYRDIHRVLGVLERTRPAPYWCAAFEVARSHAAWDHARAAAEKLAAIAPDHPRLPAMRETLKQADPDSAEAVPDSAPEESPAFDSPRPRTLSERILENHTPFEDIEDGLLADSEWDALFTEELPADLLGTEPEAAPATLAPEKGSDPLRKLDLDPLTELLLSDDWIAEATSPPFPEPAPEPEPPEPESDSDPDESFMTLFGLDAVPLDPDRTALHPSEDTPVAAEQDTQPYELPSEPAGEFIRLGAPEPLPEQEHDLTTDLSQEAGTAQATSAPTSHSDPRRYGLLQAVGILSFVVIIAGVAAYILLGQGGDTLLDMLAEVQAGTSLNTATDLIGAIDAQLSGTVDNQTALRRLDDLTPLIEVVAEDSPDLADALAAWVSAGAAWLADSSAAEEACVDEEAAACAAARENLASQQALVESSRATVCALTTCPEAASVQS